MILKELYDEGVDILDESGIESPEVDAFYLLEYATRTSRASYLLNKNEEQDPESAELYMKLVNARADHIPYQYLTGNADFMGFRINVTPDVLIPRLDTEVLCDEACRLINDGDRVLDMCTGSGCIAIAIKGIRPEAVVTACDISEKALTVARENAAANAKEPGTGEIRFIRSDLFEGISGEMFDMIVSNPPYVTEGEYAELAPEVREHEPKLALTAGEDGLDIYRRLIPGAREHLKPAGRLLMEIGCSQGEAVGQLMEQAGFKDVKIIKDLAGLDRVILGRTDV